ncbi:hypothetical protein [Dokdonella sp.]|uniref:hypothetical protein n=1 Tax=Dokdonella sp. TaxID=2291710 RepID=UPI001B0EF5EE|nr:hypothetical protein [Dokdonella sp.]MBO9664605.1 hypothetical protein [Dokdonella sp.]
MPSPIRSVLSRLAWAAAALCLGASALQAKPVDPPLELLYSDDNRLVAGSLIEINPAGRLVFQRKDVLDGKKPRPPEKIDVRVPRTLLDRVTLGERYIVGYATGRKDPRDPLHRAQNPDGPQMLVSIGLDPALFRDTPQVRALLATARSERGRESRKMFDQLMQALAGPDRALQDLAAGQIALDAELGERLREHGHATVEKVARDAGTPPDVRASLLQSAALRPADLGGWWQEVGINLVTTTPVGGYSEASPDPSNLVLTTLELLDQHAVKVPSDALKRWVWSANPAVAERASLMLRRQSAALERSTIQQALADPALPATTRKFLEGHLRRLERLDERAKAGTG